MTKEKGSTNHSGPSKSIDPRLTAKDIKPIEQAILKELGVYCKSDGELVLAREVALNRAIIMQLQEAVAVGDRNYELALKTISEAANKIAEIRATNAVHMKAISARLERLESK